MKKIRIPFLLSSGIIFSACQHNSSLDQVVSQTYVHKYGFDIPESEWDERTKDGLIVEMLKNGVKVSRSYEDGVLQGITSYTFPNSALIEKAMVYDQGVLIRETTYDLANVPVREEVYEFGEKTLVTLWDEKGVPLSIEEYENDVLVNGKYYTSAHELEGKVEHGYGYRMKRDRTGLLIAQDKIENGAIVEKISYHPSGEIHTISHYHDFQLHGPQTKFTPSGKPLMQLSWNHGVLDGPKTIYRNGMKIAEIPYASGEKHGVEYHYDDLGTLISETNWENDQKHGLCKVYTEESVDREWFFRGQPIDEEKFTAYLEREKLIAEMQNAW